MLTVYDRVVSYSMLIGAKENESLYLFYRTSYRIRRE